MSAMAIDPVLEQLTEEQLLVAGLPAVRVFLEAAPGSGKTTVSAQRYGAIRYLPASLDTGHPDERAVLAVSFTRSATRELRERVRRNWGPTAVQWPHRIVTLDTVVYELLAHLLATGHVRWPGGHTRLEVHDSWNVLVQHAWSRSEPYLALVGEDVMVRTVGTTYATRPQPAQFRAAVAGGVCTHGDVRDVLGQALARPEVVQVLEDHLRATVRSLIVDEVFDANELDIRVIELALDAGLHVTLVGDPWQALYGFRGARPDLVPALLARAAMPKRVLTRSFRWRTDEQNDIATALRAGNGITLPVLPVEALLSGTVDVVLACVWGDLWETSPGVLPLAWGAAKGNEVESATTLLLNQVTTAVLGHRATYLADALATLQIEDESAPRRMEEALQHALDLVRSASTKADWTKAYNAMIRAVAEESPRTFPKVHPNYTRRLQMLQPRLALGDRVIPGMTVHQAKGREWGTVALSLREHEVTQLASGLTETNEKHRQLYVACTRARDRTVRL